jgi:hypothetical protein
MIKEELEKAIKAARNTRTRLDKNTEAVQEMTDFIQSILADEAKMSVWSCYICQPPCHLRRKISRPDALPLICPWHREGDPDYIEPSWRRLNRRPVA